MEKKKQMEILLWSIALPGFGQLLNRKYFKGIVLIVLEMIINIMARLNMAIVYSFQGDTWQAVWETDYQWLMFYPCMYMFGIWDAYRDAGAKKASLSFLPFVFSAYLGTIGVIYSSVFTIRGFLLGPVWLPILCLIFGAGVGHIVRQFLKGGHS